MLITTCMSFSQQKYAYFDMMAFFFAIAAIFALLSGVFILQLKKINTVENTLQAERRKINLLKYKPFTAMILPNLLRGFCAGAFGIMAAIGYYFDILDSTTSGYMAVIANASAFGSCCLFALLSKRGRANNKWIVLFSSIVMAVLMPAMLITESVWVFLLLYCVAYIGFNCINLAVPVAVYKIVDYQFVGEYSAWRMLLHTLGSAIAGMACIPMFEAVGGVAVLTAVGGMQLISGIIYYGVEYCADKKGVGI